MLGLLAEEPLYGYDLLERFRARSMGFWVEVGKASVYQALRRLERDGSDHRPVAGGSRGTRSARVPHHQTGRDRLKRGLSERFASLEPYETDGGLALGFAHLLSATDARKAVDERETAVRDLLDAIKTERARVSADKGAGPGRVDGDARSSGGAREGRARVDQGVPRRSRADPSLAPVVSGTVDRMDEDGSGVLRSRQDDHLAVVVARAVPTAVPRGHGVARPAPARRLRAARLPAGGGRREQDGAPEGGHARPHEGVGSHRRSSTWCRTSCST